MDSDLEYVTGLAWEVLALCLAVWIVIKHFCQLQRQPRGWTIKDCFTVSIKTHVLYFAAAGFALTSSLKLGNMSHNMMNVSIVMYEGCIQIVTAMQLFVVGPCLTISVRAYHYQLLADSDEGTAMTTVAFQECSRESISSDEQRGSGLAGTASGTWVSVQRSVVRRKKCRGSEWTCSNCVQSVLYHPMPEIDI